MWNLTSQGAVKQINHLFMNENYEQIIGEVSNQHLLLRHILISKS